MNAKKTYLLTFIESNWYSININQFEEFNNPHKFNRSDVLITFQLSDLLRHIKSINLEIIPEIIDLESFNNQMSQEGRKQKRYKKWNAIKLLKLNGYLDKDFNLSKSSLKTFMEKLSNYYKEYLEKEKSEKNRFQDIELKINKIIHRRQLKGVRINIDKAKSRCIDLETKIYQIKNKLQFNHKIFTPENEEFQINYLKEKNFKIIKSLRYTFKIRKNDDEICGLIYNLIRYNQDFDTLLFITAQFGGKERTHPWYLGFGTITSRITLRQPSLQNLKKENRDIIIPDDSMSLFYIDYSQFEAGILASLSKDSKLIDLYNSDIYRDIAEKVLGDIDKRDEAKVLFYRYMYGDDTLSQNILSYFKAFKELDKFIVEIKNKIQKDGKIGTTNGNYRKSYPEENFSWSLSHLVQSTASLIYKNSLISVNNKIKTVDFLIPMHDGTLYQIPNKNKEIGKEIIKIYKKEFLKICPEIKVRVDSKEFC